LGDRFIRKNADPDFATPTDITSHCPSGGFDLTGSNPTGFGGLQGEIAEINRISAGGQPAHPSALLFAEFCSFGT
jgi:hypothetical protein